MEISVTSTNGEFLSSKKMFFNLIVFAKKILYDAIIKYTIYAPRQKETIFKRKKNLFYKCVLFQKKLTKDYLLKRRKTSCTNVKLLKLEFVGDFSVEIYLQIIGGGGPSNTQNRIVLCQMDNLLEFVISFVQQPDSFEDKTYTFG